MGSTTSTETNIPRPAYENNPYMRTNYNVRTQVPNVSQNVETPTTRIVSQNVETPTTRTVSQNVETPTTRTVSQNVETPTTRTVSQNSQSSIDRTVSQNVQSSTSRTVLQNAQDNTSQVIITHETTPFIPIAKENNIIARYPDNIKNLNDFLKNWNVWKEQFRSFIEIMDEEHKNVNLWGSMFLNLMGPISQEIRSLLLFHNESDSRNYATLMTKFNTFHQFNIATKDVNESPMVYIEKLKNLAVHNFKNQDEILKNKLAKDIRKLHKKRFIAVASSKLSNFKFETNFKSLTLREIAFLWNVCEQSAILNKANCICCGDLHEYKECPALGTKCDICNRENHFTSCCPGPKYINDCRYCGDDHKFKQCLAYGETCSKCGRENHFSWKCGNKILISNCHFCGLSHINDRSTCPARKSLCGFCKLYGHYDIKCDDIKKKNL